MNGRRARRDLLPALLIAAGVLWLLFQGGFVPPRVLAALELYWPLLLIGVGLDLLRLRRPWAVPYTALAAVVVVLVAAVIPAPGGSGSATAFREPVGAATQANVQLHLSSAPSRIFAAGELTTLLEARIQGRPEASFSVQGTRDKTVTVRPRQGVWLPTSFGINRWELGLGTAIPLDLRVDGGSDSANLDLVPLHLSALRVDGGSGPLTLALPGANPRYRARFDGGSGPLQVRLAQGASLDLTLDTGSGPADLSIPSGADATVELRAGSGPVGIDVPEGGAVKLEARDDGSGPLRVAPFLRRVSGNGDTGVWESPGFAGATRRIVITVASAGSGSITVR